MTKKNKTHKPHHSAKHGEYDESEFTDDYQENNHKAIMEAARRTIRKHKKNLQALAEK